MQDSCRTTPNTNDVNISLVGVNGNGKTLVSNLLSNLILEDYPGKKVVIHRHPGQTEIGSVVRGLLKKGAFKGMPCSEFIAAMLNWMAFSETFNITQISGVYSRRRFSAFGNSLADVNIFDRYLPCTFVHQRDMTNDPGLWRLMTLLRDNPLFGNLFTLLDGLVDKHILLDDTLENTLIRRKSRPDRPGDVFEENMEESTKVLRERYRALFGLSAGLVKDLDYTYDAIMETLYADNTNYDYDENKLVTINIEGSPANEVAEYIYKTQVRPLIVNKQSSIAP